MGKIEERLQFSSQGGTQFNVTQVSDRTRNSNEYRKGLPIQAGKVFKEVAIQQQRIDAIQRQRELQFRQTVGSAPIQAHQTTR